MKSFLILLCLYVPLAAGAQPLSVPGYYVGNDGKRVEGFLINREWVNNPTEISFALSEYGIMAVLPMKEVLEFGSEKKKYIRTTVKMDTSSQDIKFYSLERAPYWKESEVFLKVLVEGKASLFIYRRPDLELFFFSTDQIPVEQLVFKNYQTTVHDVKQTIHTQRVSGNQYGNIASNYLYLEQLNDHVSCDKMRPLDHYHMSYRRGDLINHFKKYNKCVGAGEH